MRILAIAAVVASLAFALEPQGKRPAASAGVTRTKTAAMVDGQPIEVFTLTNASGVVVTAMTYGGIIKVWRTPDRTGQMADIVLGFDDPGQYIKGNSPYFGAVVGRYGNRIAKAQFTL